MVDMETAKEKIQTQTKKAKDDAQEIGNTLRDKAFEVGANLKSQAGDYTKVAMDKAAEVRDGVFGWVKENPGKSIGIAFLAGWLYSKK